MKKILVTGGAGFIGSHLVKKLVEKGHNVTVIDDLSTGDLKSLTGLPITFVNGDISNSVRRLADKLIQNTSFPFDEIYHLAALARIQRSWDYPEETYDVNVTGTNNILELARQYNVKKVFITSSSSVFAGMTNTEPMPYRIEANSQRIPLNPYAYHKYLDEELAFMYRLMWKMDIKVGRPFNVYGEGQNYHSDYSTLIPKFAEQKKNGEKLTVYGDGTQTRDFTYVGDIVDMMIASMEDEENWVFNLCASKPVSINDIAEAFNHTYEHVENPRKGEATWTWGENNTGVEPKVNIIDWIKQNYG